MKKYLTIAVIGIIAITVMSCASTASANDDGEIYGNWRYVITRGEYGDTYAEERLSTSVLRITKDKDSIAKVEFVRGAFVYQGNLSKMEDNVYNFKYLSISDYGEYEMNDTLTYDPATNRLALLDGESGMSVTFYELAK
ncbi:MAG: hypothetical protein FWD14_01035 [Treponema sp.]|nr:hypothetical protein [Treponema sp.]